MPVAVIRCAHGGRAPAAERGPDPARLRISDSERHQVAEILREAAGEGRLDIDELDQRLEATYAARTYADLVPITLDLPATRTSGRSPGRAAASPDVVPGADRESHFAILSGLSRKGVWVVPEQMTILAMMGGAELDLRRAKFAAPEVVITINAFMGGAQVIVGPPHPGADGGHRDHGRLLRARPAWSTPASTRTHRSCASRAFAIWGGVSVERKHL